MTRRRDRRAGPVPVDRRSRHHPVPLDKGRLVQDSPKFATPRTLAFDSYDLPVSLPVIDQFRGRGGNESDELYLHELWRVGYGGGRRRTHQRLEAQAHFNFRLVEVVMMLMLPLLAVSLAVPPKRSSSSLGIFLSILIVVAYHKVNQYAEQAGTNGQLNPIVALWVPLVLLSALIVLDVPHPRPPARRAADRRARMVLRQASPGACARLDAQGAGSMINLGFFPSRRLAFYMVRLFLTRSLAVLVALVLVLMTLDLLGESGKILAVPGNGDAELWRYVGLRIPLLISRFLPFSVLLGTLIAFVGLNQHSEVVAMKAAGLSAHQILAPLIVASIGIAGRLVRLQREASWSSRRAWSTPGRTMITSRSRPKAACSRNVWVLERRRPRPRRDWSVGGARLALQRRHHLRPRGRRAAAHRSTPTRASRARRPTTGCSRTSASTTPT